jgi:hypothetical protein
MPKKLIEYIENLLKNSPNFTGSIEVNVKDGIILDVVKRERTKL